MADTKTCRQCGDTFEYERRPGRAPLYCSEECREAWLKEYHHQRHIERRDEFIERARRWQQENPERFKDYQREYTSRRRQQDPRYNTDWRAMRALRTAIKTGVMPSNWERAFRYDADTFRRHLESMFTLNMTWETYGSVWEIDHIVPRSWFHYQSEHGDDFRACYALHNMRPLYRQDNRGRNRFPIVGPFPNDEIGHILSTLLHVG